MIPILNRIFPEDISRRIFKIYMDDYIDFKVIPKQYILKLMMEKKIDKYFIPAVNQLKQHEFWLMYEDIEQIHRMLMKIYNKVLIYKYYEFDADYTELIKKYNTLVEYRNETSTVIWNRKKDIRILVNDLKVLYEI